MSGARGEPLSARQRRMSEGYGKDLSPSGRAPQSHSRTEMQQQRAGEEIFETPDVEDESKEDVVRVKEILTLKHDRSTDIARETLLPRAAFEVFAGRVYETSLNPELYSIPDQQERKAETPLQRFTRLKHEVSDLSNDLAVLCASSEGAPDDGRMSVWGVLQSEAAQLSTELSELKAAPAYTTLLQQTQQPAVEFQTLMSTLGSIGSTPRPSSSNVTYELYYDPTAGSGEQPASLAAMEARVSALEELIGASSSASDTNEMADATRGAMPLIEAVSKLDHKVSLLDKNKLETLKEKAAALKTELEAVGRERGNKGTLAWDSRAAEQARRVDELYEKVQHVEAVSVHLPTVVARMRTLHALHRDCAIFGQRLMQLESVCDTMSSQVASDSEVLEELRKAMHESVQRFNDNIRVVDERIRGLR